MNSDLYLFVIWETSLHKKDIILEDIQKKFIIRNIYEIKWSKQNFRNNLKRFYGSSLPNAKQKMDLCGTGPFLLILISDPNPQVEKKLLDDVNEVNVNLNVYNSKMMYRKWIGIDFALHSSISKKETDHDLMLLLGKKTEDLENELTQKWDGSIKKIESDLIGNNGWKDMKQFLDVLNATLNYVILRNFEELPDKIIHHDIDILTDDVKTMSYIINEDESSSGKASVKIGNQKTFLDFRYQVGHHYDENWSKDILKRRVFYKNAFYIPCKKDHFYTLLSHTIMQKHIRDDYKKMLSRLAMDLEMNQSINPILNDLTKTKKFFNEYLKKMRYPKPTIYREILYKIKHTEFMRLVKVSIFLLKTYGIKFLLIKVREKIKIVFNY